MSSGEFKPTEEQKKIIYHAGSAFISACPGAGKTCVMVERARVLVKTAMTGQGIAFLSFTNAAVSELEGRLRQESLLPSPVFPHFIGTFDSFIWQYLVAPLGIPGCSAAPRLIPDKDQRQIQPFDGAQALPLSCFDRSTGQINSLAARKLGFNAAAKPSITSAYETSVRKIRERFLARGEVDFTDTRTIVNARFGDLQLSARMSAALSARFREVIVDEAQDCNPADLNIINWLRQAGIVTRVICDPHQSIYEFRGGVTEQLFAFGQTFAADDQLSMQGNFRSNDNICKAIATLRPKDARSVVDQALGKHRLDQTKIHVISYPGKSVPATVGNKFHELLDQLKIEVIGSPILAKTRASGARAIGQPTDQARQDLTMRLALAVTDFHFAIEMGNRKAAMEEVHKVVLEIEGRAGRKTYHQHIAAEDIRPDAWRPHILLLLRELRYDPAIFSSADAWHERAKELLAPFLPSGGQTIAQRLRRNQELGTALAVAPKSSPPARTIHAVKGMEFPAVCVVMTVATAKGIIDYLETGSPAEQAESAREIYVAASRAERLLVIAAPKSQADRLAAHLATTGAEVTMITL
jgi:DNA helicase-2/ATP-dependent DNA helicase PcrA